MQYAERNLAIADVRMHRIQNRFIIACFVGAEFIGETNIGILQMEQFAVLQEKESDHVQTGWKIEISILESAGNYRQDRER